MRILLLGATGKTGRQLMLEGLQQGHTITAFVRNPKALQIENNLTLFQGNVLDAKQVAEAIKGQDVVISVLGNKTSTALGKPSTTISDGVVNIIAGMKENNVKRLLFVASFGVNKEIFLPEKLFIKTVLRNIFADIPLQEKLIKESGLEWTIVHPARLVDTPKTGKYKVGEHIPIGLFSRISRADVADFLLKGINEKDFLHKTITLSY